MERDNASLLFSKLIGDSVSSDFVQRNQNLNVPTLHPSGVVALVPGQGGKIDTSLRTKSKSQQYDSYPVKNTNLAQRSYEDASVFDRPPQLGSRHGIEREKQRPNIPHHEGLIAKVLNFAIDVITPHKSKTINEVPPMPFAPKNMMNVRPSLVKPPPPKYNMNIVLYFLFAASVVLFIALLSNLAALYFQ
eukprot:TRINITY_DN11966_c0_g1_i1.p1 TRINITY_DN11966_c0_g1~~TRINITY_DN11966_c0_g1_i1.p1  ORF type:complete len:190 (+),score=34.61 TRINITY_DN11966_c0_g1_i1:21-590(+)